MKTGYIPAHPRRVRLVDAEDLTHPLFHVPRGMEVSLTPLEKLTPAELDAFGLSLIRRGNTDLEVA